MDGSKINEIAQQWAVFLESKKMEDVKHLLRQYVENSHFASEEHKKSLFQKLENIEKSNMTDKELLELAAKAAGAKGRLYEKHPMDGHPTYSVGIGVPGNYIPLWNPLTNDGDALRLAVKCRIEIVFWPENKVVCCYQEKPLHIEDTVEPFNGDPYVATRRAIVLAAAEIGKTK